MAFLVMVKADDKSEAGVMADHKLLSAMGKYNKTLLDAGILLAGDGLHASKRGARVKVSKAGGSSKNPIVVDGPFAEAKELVGGYWVLDLNSKEEVLEWVKRVPFDDGSIEVRELQGGLPDDNKPARKPGTRRYMLLLKADPPSEAGAAAPPGVIEEMNRFVAPAIADGTLMGGRGLRPSAAGARVAFSGSQRKVIDGPFTEAKELIAGYAIVQVASKDEAVAFARRWLQIHVDGMGVEAGEIEVRLMQEIEDYKIDPAEKAEKGESWREQERKFRDGSK